MIPQKQNNGRSRGRSNAGRPAPAAQRNYSRIPIVSDVIDMFSGGGGQPEMQTTTQQNLPSWAIPDAMSTLAMGNYYTQNPDYRASTLDRDYSGIRGGASGVGQFGLNPRRPALPGANLDGTLPYRPNDINNLVAQLPPDLQGGGTLFRGGPGSQPGVGIADRVGANVLENEAQRQEMLRQREGNGTMQSPQGFRGRPGTGLKFADQMPTSGRGLGRSTGWFWDSDDSGDDSSDDSGWSWEAPQIDLPDWNFDSLVEDTWLDNRPQSDPGELAYPTSLPETPTQSPQGDIRPDGSNSEGQGYPTGNPTQPGNVNPDGTPVKGGPKSADPNYVPPDESTVNPQEIFNPDDLTPFQSYDRQRFAAPGANTLRGEGILAGRYDQRFGPRGTDPFAAANQAVGTAANYQSGFQGTMGEGGLGGQAGNYQQGLGSATDPNVFQAGNYTSGLPNFANPNANVSNVNQGLRSTTFGNANANLTGAQNYNRNFQDLVNQSNNPYQEQVVNQTISDLNRARQMTQNEIGGQAAKAGAFGGSRQALLEAENNRNYLDRVAAATGQLRQQGFESAANRAQQENLQRLGLTASDTQNVRGFQSQGNLAAQGLTARDAQDVRGLQSQGGLAAQGLESQGALAALGANAGLYQSALGLNAAGDRSAMGYNAGLLSDAMGLDAADLNQRRNLASNEAQFAETANRGAGALNLQGGQALGQLAQAGTADERQRIADILAAGGAGDARNQQDLDFIFNEFNRELAYPGQQIDLRNAAISPATGSIVTTTQPRYQQNPILGGLGGALTTYGITSNPYLAGAAGLLGYLNS